MRKILLLTAMAALMCSCASIKPQPRQTITRLLDFRPYSEAGFFVSGDPYPAPHTPIGDIYIEVIPALIPYSDLKSGFEDGVYRSPSVKVAKEEIVIEELLDEAVAQALKLNSDGICNLEIRTENHNYQGRYGTVIFAEKYIISGTCIKINQ